MLTSKESAGALDATANPLRLALRVFVVFAVVYLCTWGGHYTSGDGAHKVDWAKAMLFGQAPGVSPDQNGIYSKYGIGHSLLAIPPMAAAYLIQKTTRIRSESALYTFMFVVNGAFFLALVAYYLARFYSSRDVWATVLIIGLATTWWPYTKLDFSEPLVLTIAFLGFVLMRFGYPAAGMLVAGFTLAIRTDSVLIIVPMLVWYLWANRSVRAAVQMALALAPSIALVLAANYVRYHSVMDHGYGNERFSSPLLVGLYGLLLSSGKSIFLFSPPLLLGLWGWRRFAQRADSASDAWLFLGISVAQLLFYSKWWDWSSDDAWGVRFLVPGVLLMCIPMVTVVYRRALVIPIVALGVSVQLLAVTTGGLNYLMLIRSSQPPRAAVFMHRMSNIDLADVWFNPNYSQLYGHWILLRYLLHIPPEAGRSDDPDRIGTPLYEAIPPEQWKAFAHWDFIWNLPRSAATDPRKRQ